MKTILFCLGIIVSSIVGYGQKPTDKKSNVVNKRDTAITVEASCGQCQFKMEGKGCNLAVRLLGKSYYVDGANLDDHGDAHADDGFCNKIRHAKVKGKLVDGRFKSTYFKLLPEQEKDN